MTVGHQVLPPIEVRERSTRGLDRSYYRALEGHPEALSLIEDGIVSLIRSKSPSYGLRAGAYVGQAIIQGVCNIIITPKKTGALESLLHWSVPDDVRSASPSSLVALDSPVLHIFAAQFLDAMASYISEGRVKAYVPVRRVGVIPRGRIDTRATMVLEARGRGASISYVVRRLTADLPINRCLALGLLAVDELLRSSASSARLLARARSYSYLFDDTGWNRYRRLPMREIEKLFNTALREVYTPHGRAALLYSRALVFSLGAWPTEDSSAISVPNSFFISLETLFEDAVRNVVGSVQPLAKKGAALGLHIFPGRSNVYLADPDIVVPHHNGLLVLDTKYKDLQGHAPQHADVYQILAHSEAVGAEAALLVYPLEVGADSEWQMTELGASTMGVRVFVGQVDVSRLETAVIGLLNDVMSEVESVLLEDVG